MQAKFLSRQSQIRICIMWVAIRKSCLPVCLLFQSAPGSSLGLMYMTESVAIVRFLLQPVQISIQMDPCTCVEVRSLTSFVCRKLGTCSSAACFHEIQTMSSLANIRFLTSMPGVARNLHSSLGSELNFVCVLSLLSIKFHMELRES